MTTHTDLIKRLRAYPTRDGVEAADALESLEQQVAALTEELQKRDKCSYMGPMRDCPTHGIGPELAASQARESKMREALEGISCDNHHSRELQRIALDIPTDDTALKERLKGEYERGYADASEILTGVDRSMT